MTGPLRLLLAAGLMVSAGLVAAVGGGWGLIIAAGQVGAAVAVLMGRPLALAGVVLVVIPAPLGAIRHWTARLPGACHCARLRPPPPGLLSVTGLVVALNLSLLASVLWWLASHRMVEVGKSSP